MPYSLLDSAVDTYKSQTNMQNDRLFDPTTPVGSSRLAASLTTTSTTTPYSSLLATTTAATSNTSALGAGRHTDLLVSSTDMLLGRLASSSNTGVGSTTSRMLNNLTSTTSGGNFHATSTTTPLSHMQPSTSAAAAAGSTTMSSTHHQSALINNNNSSKRIESSSSDMLQQLLEDLRQIEDTVDSIEIPARGRCKVYMAKFGYDPFEQSPNENPEAELALNAGDYIMVFDDIDEDGYFIGELIDGRRGYVPSNYLDRLTGDDLFDFQANVLYKQANGQSLTGGHKQNSSNPQQQHQLPISGQQQTSSLLQLRNPASGQQYPPQHHLSLLAASSADFDPNDSNSYPPEFYEAIIGDTLNHSNFQHLHIDPEDYHRMNDYVDLEDVDEIDDECLSDYERAEAEQMRRAVAPPQRLVLERQLNKSILISWLHPQAAKGTIVSYQIYVDGVMKSTVPSGDRTKALLEGVDSNVPHRISVRAIDLHGTHSNDAACTIVTGKQVPFAPACVKASHITSDSALISWLPCNSNFHHVVAVNSVEVQTVRGGVYKHLINGLSANTLYRVWVRAKPGKILSVDEKNPKKLESLSTYVDFKTMPKSLPDPPVNVQVEAGPQRRTLLVTWLPLTLNDFGVSNGCPITGYAIFAGHKKLADIDSPTGDHALLDLSDLESLHKKSVTVRTKSGENLSQDSMPCHIPDEYLKFTSGSNSSASKHQYLDQLNNHPVYGGAGAGRRGASSVMHNSTMQNARLSSSDQQDQNYLMSNRFGNQLHHNQSPHRRGRLPGQMPSNMSRQQHLLHQQQQAGRAGRHMSRSLQNLESDLESRRSSIGTAMDTASREQMMLSGKDNMINNTCESYSEEEFESSMRCRGLKGGQRGTTGGGPSRSGAAQQRFRGSRGDSHSLDGQNRLAGYQSGSLAKLRASSRPDGQSATGPPMQVGLFGPGGVPIRFFVALFDYDPSVMSPNPNAAVEELAFKEGSIIKIFGDKGVDGFYQGELDGQVGFVPCNVISEIRDQKLVFNLAEKHRQKQVQSGMAGSSNYANMQQQNDLKQLMRPINHQQHQQIIDNQQQQQQQNGFKRMVALYDYDPQENSPNADTESEIPFKQGDVIYIYGKMDTDGFFLGEVERTKQRGLVPSNFLRDEVLNIKQQQHQPSMNAKQQQQMMQQQKFANNLNNAQMMGPNGAMNPIDTFQQPQQQRQQLQQQTRQMNPNINNQMVNGQNVQQFQPLNQLRNQAGGQQLMNQQQQQAANLLNRPSSLSLMNAPGQQTGANMMTAQMLQQQHPNNAQDAQAMMQPQQQLMMQPKATNQQNMSINASNNTLQHMMGSMQMNNQNQNQNPNQNQLQHQPQLQQHQAAGGVLSNLLSSGKQIIGAATTPRGAPSQNLLMGNNQMFPGQNQVTPMMQQQHQIQQPQNSDQLHSMGMANNQQQQQQLQHQHQMMNNNTSNKMMAGSMSNVMQTHPISNQGGRGMMGPSYGPNVGNPGEEQGGNILNTVKNMFKL